MKAAHRIRWVRAGHFGLALAGSLLCSCHKEEHADLPAAVHYAKLPEAFDHVLQISRQKAEASHLAPGETRQLAQLYLANRLFPEAQACYRVIAATPPGLSARDHYFLAGIAADQGDMEQAQTELRAVLKTEAHYLPAQLTLAESLFKSGREDEAAKEYAAILATEANQPQAALGLARIELQRGQDDAAVARLEELMAGHPEATAAAGLFAQVLERRGEKDRAIAMTQLSQQKPELPPADPWRDALLADCYDVQRLSITFEEYFKNGRMKEAVPLLDRLSALDPKGPITMMFSGFSHAKALEHVTAIREYYAALAAGGDPEKICPYLVQSLLALGKGDEALGLMADYHAKMPESAIIAQAYANLAIKQGDPKSARPLLEAILQKQPNLLSENMSLAKIIWEAGDRDAAVKYLQRVASVYATDVPSRALLGEYYLGKADPLAAIPPLREALGLSVAQATIHDHLAAMLAGAYLQAGNAAAEKGKLTDTVSYADQAIHLIPGDVNGYASKADACVQLKQFRPAADALEKLISLQPDNPTFYLSLGDVKYQDSHPDEAHQDWQKARQLVAAGDTELIAALDQRLSGQITAETFK